MARITLQEAQAWGEQTKLPLTTLDQNLLAQVESEVLARFSGVAQVSSWTDESSTPSLVRTIIAKLYVTWLYRRTYSEALTDDDAVYAMRLEANAEALLSGILDGTIELPDITTGTTQPIFYPNDASSALEPTPDDRSLGDARFSMGQVF